MGTPKKQRSRVSNGYRFLENADGRSPIVRRYKDITLEVIGDLGGEEVTSEGQRQLARRAAAISIQCEAIEAQLCRDGTLADDGSVGNYVALVNVLNRTFSNLGLKRKMKDVSRPFGLRAELGLTE